MTDRPPHPVLGLAVIILTALALIVLTGWTISKLATP